MTSSPYVQPWAANAAGTPPPTGYDQAAPNPVTSTYVDPLAPVLAPGAAAPVEQKFADFPIKSMPELKAPKETGLTYMGEAMATPSATGGAYGYAASSYGGPVYKDKAGKYYSDKAGKYPIPAGAGYTLSAAKKGKK
ncbi:MAG: hypothetical protein ABW318_22330 [Vicinamibacterales bacterium]